VKRSLIVSTFLLVDDVRRIERSAEGLREHHEIVGMTGVNASHMCCVQRVATGETCGSYSYSGMNISSIVMSWRSDKSSLLVHLIMETAPKGHTMLCSSCTLYP
jgi:hypothetical protein